MEFVLRSFSIIILQIRSTGQQDNQSKGTDGNLSTTEELVNSLLLLSAVL